MFSRTFQASAPLNAALILCTEASTQHVWLLRMEEEINYSTVVFKDGGRPPQGKRLSLFKKKKKKGSIVLLEFKMFVDIFLGFYGGITWLTLAVTHKQKKVVVTFMLNFPARQFPVFHHFPPIVLMQYDSKRPI